MAISERKDGGLHIYVYRYADYPSPALTDYVVGFLQSHFPQSSWRVSIGVVMHNNKALSMLTPFLLYTDCGDEPASRSAPEPAVNVTCTHASPIRTAGEEQLLPLHGGQPMSDWAAARLIIYQVAATGDSVDFLLGARVEPRLLKNEATSQKKASSSNYLRYSVASAIDVCESWWAFAEAQTSAGYTASEANASAQEFAAYFAALLGTPAPEGTYLPFLFDTQSPTLADMGLHALIGRFGAGRVLMQKALEPYFTSARPSTAGTEESSFSHAATAAGARLLGWMERVTAATLVVSGDGTGSSISYGHTTEIIDRAGGKERGALNAKLPKNAATASCHVKNTKPEADPHTVVHCDAVTQGNSVNNSAVSDEAGQLVDGPDASGAVNFLKQIVETDIRTGRHKTVVTRFPPEPNGFLHLGHAKSICVNFGLATAFNGRCHLRFDDTNPMKEEMRYIQSIQRDVKWLGGDWGGHLYYASDYFQQLYDWAEFLIKKGLAFVDDDDQETIRRKRGSITQPGENSGFRNRSIGENLDLFRRMKAGEFEEGARVLRAKIDMKHSNMNMRDPIMYRILKKTHPRTGDQWVIYPTYDYAHGQSDSIEGITHSICTLEFELHRPLYNWFQEALEIPLTRQIEFARLNVTNTVMSKRKLLALVMENWVSGWDDPRLPTLSGLRRRGVPAAALRTFCDRVGVARRESIIQLELLERCIREALHPVAPRRFAIQQPLRLSILNFEGKEICITAPNHPENPAFGTRELHFTNSLYIDREDFMETPVPGYHRLVPGGKVRLKHAYQIQCEEVVKDASGQVVELRCTYDPQSKTSSVGADGKKVKGTIQWLSAKDATPCDTVGTADLYHANEEKAALRKRSYAFTVVYLTKQIQKKSKKATLTQAGAIASILILLRENNLLPNSREKTPRAERRPSFANVASLKVSANSRSAISIINLLEEAVKIVYRGLVEQCVTDRKLFPPQSPLQFERLGFFTPDASTLPEEDVPEEESGVRGTEAIPADSIAGAENLPVFNLTVSLQEGFTSTEDEEKGKAKAQDRLAREKAAMERQKKKEEREMKKMLKEKQLVLQQISVASSCKREPVARSREEQA